ncbi:hypothetical protein CUJ89_25360 [Burkholderia pyrrocinia]|uniref:Uncharacterized protein n=1 Tax=Burkholderia pyrrocinia TaxID=60550 RepID=A0A2Z5N2K2_BURPY|nr:hypothetical protein CUJ89_25360 [Burkholderia pyrrocinia]
MVRTGRIRLAIQGGCASACQARRGIVTAGWARPANVGGAAQAARRCRIGCSDSLLRLMV